MSFQAYPIKREEIYREHLRDIAGVKFTLREIDIIACILHNRGAKKIGSLLNIASRTAATHTYNIMQKLRTNSREYIIDLVEKSGKLQHLRLYYANLLTEAAFIKMLNTIKKLLNSTKITYHLNSDTSDDMANVFALQISKYLALAGINIATDTTHTDTDGKNIQNYYLHVIDKVEDINLLPKDSIVLVLGEYDNKFDIDATAKYIDFSPKDNFYFSCIRLIEYLVDKPDIQKTTNDFKTEYRSLQNSWDGGKLQDIPHIDNTTAKRSSFLFLTLSLKAGVTIAIAIILLIAIFWKELGAKVVFKNLNPTQYTISENLPEQDPDIKLFLEIARNSDFSADNIRKEQMHKNNNLATQIAKMAEYIDDTKIQSYLYNVSISAEIVLDVAHNLHALSAYYMYNQHDGDKARKLLLYAKNLLEHCINNHSGVKFNFDNLTKEEIHAELSIIKDLPEMYARVIYALGRTYIYQGNKQDAVKYFEMSRYISHKTSLFEEYLSIVSGLEIIKKDEIDNDVKNGSNSAAQNKLLESIALYKKLQSNSIQYKLDYKPNAKVHTVIDPSKDTYNQVILGEKIVRYYSTLMTITDYKPQKSMYLQEILYQLCGERGKQGILGLLKETEQRRAALIYNTLGNLILELYKTSTSFDSRQFQKAVIKKLWLVESDNSLDIPHQLFDLSVHISRNTDFTKADAYDGLIKVYQAQIDTTAITTEQEKTLEAKITDLKAERDRINNSLKRTPN